jgi:hypothetical protein
MTKMEEHLSGTVKDAFAFLFSYKLALNIFAVDSHILTGLFALGGIVLGRVLDWSWESWKKRRLRRKIRRKLSH